MNGSADISMSLSQNVHQDMNVTMKAGLGVFGFGLLMLFVCLTGASNANPALFFFLSFGFSVVGGLMYIVPQLKKSPAGIRNNNIFFSSAMSRGAIAWIIGILFTGFYIVLYWFPHLISNWIRLVDPLSLILRGKTADQWFLYGTFYTLAVLIMGTRMIVKYRHSRYQILRTSSVMFFQLGFAFIIPSLLELLNQPGFYFTYFWPLRPYSLWPSDFQNLLAHPGGLGIFMIFWGVIMTFIATPVLTYFFGKRWYCSWVCGCGGLAETLGDPFRQLSDKSLRAWKIERILIYSVLIFVTVTTSLLWLNSYFSGTILGNLSGNFASWYGFLIGSVFSGVIGTGFYPIMGSRVWCRFGCPMAAILGILQKYYSRFRITTNGSQCISCGNCSTYCEMGIDVRAYAQRGENIVRASCVGCGVCSAVCPRGVLNLENGPSEKRFNIQ
ncbi:4Fe-4S binding protein [bacterium]|nr:MAG: 4Fe-4S binding protein [bacterium]